MKILLVDDDQELCELLARYLNREGIDVDQAHTGSEGLQKCSAQTYDAMVLDVMMPGMGGLEVLTELRKTNQLPVVMLTAKGDEMDRIVGLEIGAVILVNSWPVYVLYYAGQNLRFYPKLMM
jgi:DNA-binding response OmpR family regulator